MKSKAKLFSKSQFPAPPVCGNKSSHRAGPVSLAWLAGFSAALVLLFAAAPRSALAQATPNPPDRLTYQGYLVDANGAALGATAPKNYDVIFRIWNDQNSSDVTHRLWTEQQTVTVDKGYFSVLLGEGSQYSTEPHPNISALFAAPDASDRYVEITVKGIGSGSPASDVTILPRLRLLTSPYAFLAQKAVNAASLVNNSNAPIVSASGTSLTINGSASANSFSGNGASLTSLNAGNITSGTLSDLRLTANVALRNANQTFTGNNTFNSLSLSPSVGSLRLNNMPIYFRDGSDENHFLAYNSSVDGAELRGWSGGFLSTGNGGIHNALQWNTTTVTVNNHFVVSAGAITPAVGNTPSAGIEFPLNPGGGSGDEAFIRYYVRSQPEQTTLAIGNQNDTDDNIALMPGGAVMIGIDGTIPAPYKLYVAGTAVSTGGFLNLSDKRLKKDFSDFKDPLATVLALHGVSFDWRRDEFPDRNFPTNRQIGFIAQEVETVLPEVVTKDLQGFYSLNYSEIVPVLVEAIKQQQKELESKGSEITLLKEKISSVETLQAEVENLKSQLAAQQKASADWLARDQEREDRLAALERVFDSRQPQTAKLETSYARDGK